MNNIIDVGTPPESFTNGIIDGWTTINVCFHGFANLTTTREESVKSPEFSCFGHQWRMYIYPGGDEDSNEGHVSIDLVNMSKSSIKLQWGCSVRDTDGKQVVFWEPVTKLLHECDEPDVWDNASWIDDFAKRTELLDALVNGTLVIEVRMKLPSTSNKVKQFIPANPFNKNMLELFMDEETADVFFEVGGEQQKKGKRKKTKTTTTSFHAHRLVLKNNASALYEMCAGSGEEGISTVSITDVKPKVFKHVIYYSYGGKLSEDELKDNAKDIINACDKYGVVNLKLEAEACYVESTEITMDNMMDNLLYADSKNLALLKEAVMDYIVANKHNIIGKVSFGNVPGDTCTDILTAVARGEQPEGSGEDDETIKYNKMRVGTLRKMLDEKGLDVDGSRESMIALLKEESS